MKYTFLTVLKQNNIVYLLSYPLTILHYTFATYKKTDSWCSKMWQTYYQYQEKTSRKTWKMWLGGCSDVKNDPFTLGDQPILICKELLTLKTIPETLRSGHTAYDRLAQLNLKACGPPHRQFYRDLSRVSFEEQHYGLFGWNVEW